MHKLPIVLAARGVAPVVSLTVLLKYYEPFVLDLAISTSQPSIIIAIHFVTGKKPQFCFQNLF